MSKKLVLLDTYGQPIINPTNEDFISWLLNESPFGPLSQMVIVEAIRYYTEKVSNTEEPEDKPEEMINPKAWHACCKDIHTKMVANYEGK